MRNGDLSNEIAPGVGVRFERVIQTTDGRLNRAAKAYLQALWHQDISIYIITTASSRKALSFLAKWNVPYFRVIEADGGVLEVPQVVRELDLLTYFDVDKAILQNINSRGHGKIDARLFEAMEVA